MTKILIIRFSSIGDIIQNMSVVGGLKNHFPDAEIHWVARKDMSSFLAMDRRINRIWGFDKTTGFKGLLSLAKELKNEKFDYIYDAHSNIRSSILNLILKPTLKSSSYFAQRSKERWKRFLLFQCAINKFPKPFRGIESYRKPLAAWGVRNFDDHYSEWVFPKAYSEKWDSLITEKTVTIVPSANWEMKRWPIAHWQKLIALLPEYRFIVLAGPTDTFCEELVDINPNRVMNLAGKSNLLESCYLISKSNFVVSGDTGFLHAADLFHINAIALMGPTAFGFPTYPTTICFEVNLPCRPCTKDGRGKCSQTLYQRCMVEITPKQVAQHIRQILK